MGRFFSHRSYYAAGDIFFQYGAMYIYEAKVKRKSPCPFIIGLLFLSIPIIWLMVRHEEYKRVALQERVVVSQENIVPASTAVQDVTETQLEEMQRPIPPPVSMKRLRSEGCVADGLFSDFNPESEEYISLVNRSQCYYLHRAVDTWLNAPDFFHIDQEMQKVQKKDVVYGMFIAEAISHQMEYTNADTGKKFKFDNMCREGTEGFWGPHTCKADFASVEYRRYVKYITRKAMDLGIQSFTFGQIYFQEGAGGNFAPDIVASMREYAKEKGIDIVVGAQTGDITDEHYLKTFDFIEGGVGLGNDGSIENGPCLSTRGGCWALLWHDSFAKKANTVLLHLDWSGIKSDDLDIFARMDESKREKVLRSLYEKFNTKKTGFLMPLLGFLDRENGGCRGPKKRLYSADNTYGCKDEDVINAILTQKKDILGMLRSN